MGQAFSTTGVPTNSTQPGVFKVKTVPYLVYYDGAWYGMLCLAIVLIMISALFAGLTLAVCGLNTTILDLRGTTGNPKQRQQALVVAQMKRHHTWMLCSLIICSVLCGESLPFVVQSLWDKTQQWVPIIISTLSIAFFAEILPQFWIPQHAIEWGYYCWLVIWGSMWITCIISWPVAKILDYFSGKSGESSIFSNDELASLIKYHEKSEKHGGSLGQDTTRVMMGALSLDGHKIGANFSTFPETHISASKDKDSDVEKGDMAIVHGMVVSWSTVKTVNIDELIDRAFIEKVKSWSYSRIPVVSEARVVQAEPGQNTTSNASWDAKKVFGFIHIKHLVGLPLNSNHDPKPGLHVRDIPLYPLLIVQDDMSAYKLLNMFHLGMSKIALVISASPTRLTGENLVPKNPVASPHFQRPCWTGTERTNARINARIKSRLNRVKSQPNWDNPFLDPTSTSGENFNGRKHNVVGISCPEPLGIITFEDIINRILRTTIHDERDFYDRDERILKIESERAGSYGTMSTALEDVDRNITIPAYIHETHLPLLKSQESNTLRKRKPSNTEKTAATMDGADEQSPDAENGNRKEKRKEYADSSYTQNSRGGFHGTRDSSSSFQNTAMVTSEELTTLEGILPPTPVNPEILPRAVLSLPSRKETSPFISGDWSSIDRRYVSAMPNIPSFHCVTPFSRRDFSSYEQAHDRDQQGNELMVPSSTDSYIGADSFGMDISEASEACSISGPVRQRGRVKIDDEFSLNSWCYGNICDMDDSGSRVYNESSATPTLPEMNDTHVKSSTNCPQDTLVLPPATPYNGFPLELLNRSKYENQVPDFASKTLPRMIGFSGDLDGCIDRGNCGTPIREKSFHDDRALLPSQRRALNVSTEMSMVGVRSTSFWF